MTGYEPIEIPEPPKEEEEKPKEEEPAEGEASKDGNFQILNVNQPCMLLVRTEVSIRRGFLLASTEKFFVCMSTKAIQLAAFGVPSGEKKEEEGEKDETKKEENEEKKEETKEEKDENKEEKKEDEKTEGDDLKKEKIEDVAKEAEETKPSEEKAEEKAA